MSQIKPGLSGLNDNRVRGVKRGLLWCGGPGGQVCQCLQSCPRPQALTRLKCCCRITWIRYCNYNHIAIDTPIETPTVWFPTVSGWTRLSCLVNRKTLVMDWTVQTSLPLYGRCGKWFRSLKFRFRHVSDFYSLWLTPRSPQALNP